MSKKLVNADREGDDPACIATPVSTTELVRVCSCSVDEKRGEGKPGLGTEEDVGLTGEVDAGGLGKTTPYIALLEGPPVQGTDTYRHDTDIYRHDTDIYRRDTDTYGHVPT